MPEEGQRHHYIPICYLKQWLNSTGKICQYSMPYRDRVVAKSKHPSGAGYVCGLYDFKGVKNPEIRESLEREFMSPVDSQAAELMRKVTANQQTFNDPITRSSWTTFLLSLMFRMPEDIELHKEQYVSDFLKIDPKRRRYYKKKWRPGLPDKIEDMVAMFDQQEIEWRALEALVPLMTNPNVGNFINEMQWGSIVLPFDAPVLLTSDRPLIVSNDLINPDSHIIIPVGPKHIFYAVNDRRFIGSLRSRGPKEVAMTINRAVVRQAMNFVYSQWDLHQEFVQSNMGKARQPSLIDRMQNSSTAQKYHRKLKRLRKWGNIY